MGDLPGSIDVNAAAPKENQQRSAGPKRLTKRPRTTEKMVVDAPLTQLRIPAGTIRSFGQRDYRSYGWDDPYATVSPGVWYLQDNSCISAFYETGGAQDPSEVALADFVQNLYFQLYTRAGNLGLSVTGFLTGTSFASWVEYFDLYCGIYAMVRSMQAAAGIFGYNQACNVIAQNGVSRRPQITMLIDNLELYNMPPMVRTLIDKTYGVFIADHKGTEPYMNIFNSDPTITAGMDLTLGTTWDDWIAYANNQLAALRGITAVDLGNIGRLMGFLYDTPTPIGLKPIHYGDQEYFMQMARGLQFLDDTSTGVFWTAPVHLGNDSGGMIPFWIWGDEKTLDPVWLTLWGQTKYYNTTGVAFGLFGRRGMFGRISTTSGSVINYVTPNGTYLEWDATVSSGIPTGYNIPNSMAMPFAASAGEMHLANTIVSSDHRATPGWSRYYIPVPDLCDSTIWLLQTVFLDSITGPHIR
jgi:hypothetical protein